MKPFAFAIRNVGRLHSESRSRRTPRHPAPPSSADAGLPILRALSYHGLSRCPTIPAGLKSTLKNAANQCTKEEPLQFCA